MPGDELHIAPATSVDSDAIRDCLNEAFSDYLIRMPTFEAGSWPSFLHRQGVDLALSRVGVRHDKVEAFSLVTSRGTDRWRVAVMGARLAARGTGIAPRLLDETMSDAQSRGLRSVELEVFAQNERAFRLYQSRGMNPATGLHGFEAPAGRQGANIPVTAVTHQAAARRANEIEAGADKPLPWQVCGDAILRMPGVPHCWQHETAQVVFTELTGLVQVLSLLDSSPDYRNAGALLAALRATHADDVLRAPQLQAEHGPAQAFRSAGWMQAPLYQHLMVRTF